MRNAGDKELDQSASETTVQSAQDEGTIEDLSPSNSEVHDVRGGALPPNELRACALPPNEWSFASLVPPST